MVVHRPHPRPETSENGRDIIKFIVVPERVNAEYKGYLGEVVYDVRRRCCTSG